MVCTAAIRTALLGASLIVLPAAHADQALDEKIMTHILPRFDTKARDSLQRHGARDVTTRWESETRTLVAVGELDPRDSSGLTPVARRTSQASRAEVLKALQVDEICQYAAVRYIRDFLEEHAITIKFIYRQRWRFGDALIFDISHHDLEACV